MSQLVEEKVESVVEEKVEPVTEEKAEPVVEEKVEPVVEEKVEKESKPKGIFSRIKNIFKGEIIVPTTGLEPARA